LWRKVSTSLWTGTNTTMFYTSCACDDPIGNTGAFAPARSKPCQIQRQVNVRRLKREISSEQTSCHALFFRSQPKASAGCPGWPKPKPSVTPPPHRQPSSIGTPAHPPPTSSAATIAAAHSRHGGPPAPMDPQEVEFLALGHQSLHHPVWERRGGQDSLS
jgi:hypothetical protein